MQTRLDIQNSAIASLIKKTNSEQQREIALAVSKLALEKTNTSHEAVTAGIHNAEQQKFDAEEIKKKLSELIEALDNEAFAIQGDWLEDSSVKYDEEKYKAVFAKARAVSSLLNALNPDPEAAALESVYEAASALDDFALIKELIDKI